MKSSFSLTSRQRRMLQVLNALDDQAHEPIHYSAVARELGIHNSAAYEMLRTLEQLGYVAVDYIPPGGPGPGRSTVVFGLTAQGRSALQTTATANRDATWETARRQILSRLGEGERVQEEFLDELISRLSDVEEPLIYCAEVITALLLNLGREARLRLGEQGALLQRLAGPGARNLLGLLPGIALGLALPESSQRIPAKLIEYTGICQAYLQQLDETKQRALAEFVRQALDLLPDIGTGGHEHPTAVQLTGE